MKVFIKEILFFLMWYPLRIVINILPLRVAYAIGTAGGQLLYMLSGDKQKILSNELKRIMPGKNLNEINKIVRDSFINYCVSEMEVLLYPSLDAAFVEKNIVIEGREYLDAALAKGKGVLLFQAHFGAFQMTMPAIGFSGYKMNQISASASLWKDNAGFSRMQRKVYNLKASYEYSLPVRHISVKSSLRPVFGALENNEIVGITIDGGGGNKTVLIDFLGRRANFQQGSADLAIRTGAAIVPAFIITEPGIKHRLILHPPIRISLSSEKDDHIKKTLQEFVRILEGYVFRYPSHYGYTLLLRSSRAFKDQYPFFMDYNGLQDKTKEAGYA